MRYAIYVADNFALGPAYIITYLRSQGHQVKLFFDSLLFNDENYNVDKIEEYWPDVCMFSCLTATYKWALGIAKKVKERIGCKIIFGGVHPSTVPEVVRENEFIDEVCVGEGIKYFGGVFEPDKLMPTREDFNKVLSPKDIAYPFMVTSFSCPFNCTYCQPLKLNIKRRGVDICIKEAVELKNNGAKSIAFWDDVFTSDKKWLSEFLNRWKEEVRLPFRCVSHTRYVNDETMFLLKEAGCYLVTIGIQTGNEKLRREILNRHETNKAILTACATVKRYGMKLIIDHMVDLPYENDKTNQESYDLYRQIAPDMVSIFRLVYFPKAKIIDYGMQSKILNEDAIYKIERGDFNNYASGLNKRVRHDPWLNKLLAIPLKWKFWAYCHENILNLIIYYKLDKSFNPLLIITRYLFYWRKRWLP